jgi:hypothetical protein
LLVHLKKGRFKGFERIAANEPPAGNAAA